MDATDTTGNTTLTVWMDYGMWVQTSEPER